VPIHPTSIYQNHTASSKLAVQIEHFTINQKIYGPYLVPVLFTVHMSLLSYHAYQKGEWAEPEKLLTQ
jgi:hypothetical protein